MKTLWSGRVRFIWAMFIRAMWTGILAVSLSLFSSAVFAEEVQVPWDEDLAFAGGDVWRARIPIDVVNLSGQEYAGFPIGLRVGKGEGEIDLVGEPAQSIRVSEAGGTELLFDLRGPDGQRLVDGPIPAGAVLTLPVTVPAGGSQRLYVYFDNPAAYRLPDFLNGRVRPGFPETMEIRIASVERIDVVGPADPPFFAQDGRIWDIRIPVTALNPSPNSVEAIVQAAVTRLKLLYQRGFNPESLRVVDPETQEVLPAAVAGDNLLFLALLPAQSAKRFYIYLSRDEAIPQGPTLDDADLVAHPANLVTNPSFESNSIPVGSPDGWERIGQHLGVFERLRGGIVGDHFARVTIPASVTPDWTGWRQTVTVEPGARYLFLAYVRVTDVTGGNVRIHAHILEETEDGTSRQFWSAGPDLSGTTGWELLGGVIAVSRRAHTVELHLTMNVHGVLDHDGVILVRTAFAQEGEIEVNPALEHERLSVWTENPIVKVLRDTPPAVSQAAAAAALPATAPLETASGIQLFAARGEKEALQLVLRATEAMDVEIAFADLAYGDHKLPPPEIAVVGYVPVLQPSGYFSTSISRKEWERLLPQGAERTDGWQGWWPDYLVPAGGVVRLTARRTQPVWITFDVPKDAVPGVYTGTIRISGGGIEKEIPVSLKVWRFVLPERPSLQAIFDLRSGPGWSVAESDRERERWWRFMSQRRVSADFIRPEPEFRLVGGRVVMDTTAFDRAAEIYFNELQMAAAYFPSIFYAAGWAHPPRSFLGRAFGTQAYPEAYQEAVRLFWNHVKAKGWADRMVLYLSDEPFYWNPEVVERLGEIIRLIREVDPEIPVYASTWGFVPEWEGLLNHWGAAQDGRFPLDVLKRRLEAGDKVWFTTDGQIETNTPYTAVERLLPYYAFASGAHGYEYWGISWYTYNPYEYGWHSFIRQSDTPGQEYWVRYPHGDGYLAYPGRLAGVEEPVSTIRLEQAREGLEDYEIYLALRRLAEMRPELAGRIEPVLEEVRRLGALPKPPGYRSTQILPGPDAVLAVRVRAGELLDELLESMPPGSVSGRVVDPLGRELDGITLTFSAGGEGMVASTAGEWRADGIRGYAVVTPRGAGWSFSPNQAVIEAGTAGVDFAAVPPPPKVGFRGLRDGMEVAGELRPHIAVELPGPPAKSQLASVVLRFAGEVIYEGSQVPEGLAIDTSRVPDGRHRLEVEVETDDGGTARGYVMLQVNNWWEIDDALEPPQELGFFGTVDMTKTSAESPGWEYATDRPADFGGDRHRKVRKADTAEYLIWETPALANFEVTVYSTADDLTGIVGLSVSPDGQAWQGVAYKVEVQALPAAGWFVHRMRGELAGDGQMAYFRLDIAPGAAAADEVQVGHVKLVGRRRE